MDQSSQPALPINPANVKKAMDLANAKQSEKASKMDAARAVFPLIKDEPKEVILTVLRDGCGLTKQGAVTYLYNLIREESRSKTA